MVAESEEGMDKMLDKTDAYSRKWRFKFNEKNSKVMVIAGRHRRESGNGGWAIKKWRRLRSSNTWGCGWMQN